MIAADRNGHALMKGAMSLDLYKMSAQVGGRGEESDKL